MEELLPGPVTIVLERTEELNPELNPNTNLVGVRVPDHPFVRALVRSCAQPIVSSSRETTLSTFLPSFLPSFLPFFLAFFLV